MLREDLQHSLGSPWATREAEAPSHLSVCLLPSFLSGTGSHYVVKAGRRLSVATGPVRGTKPSWWGGGNTHACLASQQSGYRHVLPYLVFILAYCWIFSLGDFLRSLDGSHRS